MSLLGKTNKVWDYFFIDFLALICLSIFDFNILATSYLFMCSFCISNMPFIGWLSLFMLSTVIPQFVCCYSLWYDPSHQLRYSRPLISSSNYFDFYFYPVFVWIDSIHLPSCCRVLYKYTFCHNALCLFLPVEWKCVSILFLLHGVWRQGTPYLLLCIGCPIAFRLLSTIY